MTNKTISALTAATTPLAGTELVPIIQGGATVKATVNQLTDGQPINPSVIGVDGPQLTDGQVRIYNTTARAAGNKYGIRFADSAFETNASIVVQERSAGSNVAYLILGVNNGVGGSGITSVTDVLTLDGNGDAYLNAGNLKPLVSGKGMDFSVHSSAAGVTSKVLVDYEEGTWTPAILFDGGMTGSFTYTNQTGTYTKVGRLVTARFKVEWSAIPTAGTIMVMSLPFTAVNAANVQGFISSQGGITNTGSYAIVGGDGLVIDSYIATQCAIATVKSGAGFADPLQKSALTTAAGYLKGTIIYEV